MRQRVLLVEDNEMLAAGVLDLLIEEGFEVESTGLGRQVMAMIARLAPHVVVLDLSLPDISGIAVAGEIRRAWPALPIIFMSGHEEFAGLRDALAEPGTAILLKPFEIHWLVEAIERLTGVIGDQ